MITWLFLAGIAGAVAWAAIFWYLERVREIEQMERDVKRRKK